jgi:hypothetical protein
MSTSEQFDAAYFVEELAELVVPRIANRLVRREVELAIATVNRYLLRPDNAEFAQDAEAGRQRLATTLTRLTSDTVEIAEAAVVLDAVTARFPAAASGAERFVGSGPVLQIVVTALRLERFDSQLAVRLLTAGRRPDEAIRAGGLIGRYQWWPKWLLDLGAERALTGTLTEDFVAALDRCAYAPMTPAQTHVARRLLAGEPTAVAAAATHLERLGEHAAAAELRNGELGVVALAAKLMSY